MNPADPRWKTASNKPTAKVTVSTREVKIAWLFKLDWSRNDSNEISDIKRFDDTSWREANDCTLDFASTIADQDKDHYDEWAGGEKSEVEYWAENGELIFSYVITRFFDMDIRPQDVEPAKKWLSKYATVS